MTPAELEAELRKRGAGRDKLSDAEVGKMSPAQLREALRNMAPGKYTEAELAAMSPDELRNALRKAQLDKARRQRGAGQVGGGKAMQGRKGNAYTDDEINRMKPSQLRDILKGLGYTDEQLAQMSDEQLRAALKGKAGVLSEAKLQAMGKDDLAAELMKRFPGEFTKEQLDAMSEDELRALLRKKAGGKGYSDGELASMDADALRKALKAVAPGMFTDEELANMTEEELRRELKKRAGMPSAPGLTDEQIDEMGADDLRCPATPLKPPKPAPGLLR